MGDKNIIVQILYADDHTEKITCVSFQYQINSAGQPKLILFFGNQRIERRDNFTWESIALLTITQNKEVLFSYQDMRNNSALQKIE